MSEIGATATTRPWRHKPLLELDTRSPASAFDDFRAPSGSTGAIQIIRPFAVLSRTTYSAPVTLPIGPAYLAAVLEKAGYRVSIIDAVGEAIEQIRRTPCGRFNIQGLSSAEIIDRLDPNARVIGLSMMFSQEWIEHRSLIRAIRAAKPEATIVVGGEHATAMPEFVLQDCPEIDYLVTGEGEVGFLQLCFAIFSGGSVEDIGGLCRIDSAGRYVEGGLSRRIAKLDELPQPAWHLCPVENYFIDNWTMGIAMGRNMPILATRGCPYQCTFCSNPSMWTTRYLMRAPDDVVREIQFLIDRYRANSVDFFDLTAIVKKEWIMEFCRTLKSRGIGVTWQLPSGTRSEALDEEALQAIFDAGCRYLVYAPESGSEETLQRIKKRLKLQKLRQSVRAAVAIGHTVKVNVIIGFPHEQWRHVLQTMGFVCQMAVMGAHDCNIAVFTPYPGSELYSQLQTEKSIEPPDDDYFRSLILQFDLTVARSYTPHLAGWQLVACRIAGQALFYVLSYVLRPQRLLRLVQSLRRDRFQPANLLEQRISDIFARRRLLKQSSRSKGQSVIGA